MKLIIYKLRSGEGSYTYKDGSKYTGLFKNNEFDGIAKMSYLGGGKYHGKLYYIIMINEF